MANVQLPVGKIGNVKISRLICGGNLVIGSAHDRDLIYMAALMRAYFTDRQDHADVATVRGVRRQHDDRAGQQPLRLRRRPDPAAS